MALTSTARAATNEPRRMSADAARRTALAAQGFAQPRPTGRIDRRHLRRVFDQIGVVQIDSVNVLVRSHELPLFARLGPYPRTLIPDAVAAGELFEYWAHMASILPTAHLPLWRWRMERHRSGEVAWALPTHKRPVLDVVLAQVRDRGPLTVGDIEGRVRNKGSWWDWDDSKAALEELFVAGVIGATRRPSDFARRYDLLERIVPPAVLAEPAPDEATARRQLLLMAARSLGVGTVTDLADYYRLKPTTCKPVLDELVAAGQLVPVEVDGWRRPAVLHPDAVAPRRVEGRALLSPFDSLVWFRERTERMFRFEYRIEIYTPAPKRIFGYYVLPFLLDGQLAGRVDLKADRSAGVLRVQAAWIEDDLDAPEERGYVAEHLEAELAAMAGWLGLGSVGVCRRGTFAADLLARGLDALD